jgi:hypothetical protein
VVPTKTKPDLHEKEGRTRLNFYYGNKVGASTRISGCEARLKLATNGSNSQPLFATAYPGSGASFLCNIVALTF